MSSIRILIIHTAFIGDIVLSTPLIAKLRECYPKSEITYLTTPVGASILRNNPNINYIIEYDKRGEHKGIKGLWAIGKKLKMESYNMVITPHRYARSSILTLLTGAPIRRGYDIANLSFFYNEKIKYDKSKHEVEKLLNFVPKNEDKEYKIQLYPGTLEKETVDEMLKNVDKNMIVVAVGSKWNTKRWPLEYFNELLQWLDKDEKSTIVLVGGNEEKNYDVYLGENIIDLRGKTTLLELAEVIKRAKLVITNDSSPIHIASAFEDTKIFAIFGPTVKELGFFPWSKNSKVFQREELKCRPCSLHGGDKCPKQHFKCMMEILPTDIYQEILKLEWYR